MEFKTLLANAQRAFDNKSWREAADAWQVVLESDQGGDDPDYLFKGARSMRLAGRCEQAEAYIAKAIDLSTDRADLFVEAARISTKAEDWVLSAARWDKVAALTITNHAKRRSSWISTVINRAHAHQMLGNFAGSEKIVDDEMARGSDTVGLRNAKSAAVAGLIRDKRVVTPLADIAPVSKVDIPTICECFWEAEQKFSLTRFAIDGIYVWPLIRMQTYYRLTQLVGIYDAPHPNHIGKKQKIEVNLATQEALTRLSQTAAHATIGALTSRMMSSMWTLFNSLERNQKSPYNTDIAVLMATRKVRGEELYTLALRQEAGPRALLLDRGQGEKVKEGAVDFDKLVAQFLLQKEKASDVFVSVEERLLLDGVRTFFERRLNINLGDLVLAAQRALVQFRAVQQGFVAFWKTHPVERFFLTNAYGVTTRAAMVAAQQCGIHTIELQHGFISKYHLGYSWPEQEEVPYTPDELWGFGDYWPHATPLARSISPRTIGAPYVTDLAEKTEGNSNQNLVVFTSQGVVGRQLVEWAIETAARCPEKEVIFRLHPSENLEAYEQQLGSPEELPANFSFSHRQPVIFELLAKADIQVGAFSTTLLEGMLLGCRTVVVNLPGVEYMAPVIDRGDALFVKNIDELASRLDEAPSAQNPSYYYAKPVSPLL